MMLNTLAALVPSLVVGAFSLGLPVKNSIDGNGGEKQPLKPYSFNYEITDEQGNTHFRREQNDASGIVSGSYGYTHVNGLYRTVEYMAGADGFKARVESNEPGVGRGPGPADVQLVSKPAPSGLHGAPVGPGVKSLPKMHQVYAGRKG